MLLHFLQWQFVAVPRWTGTTLFYLHQALALQFSVLFMLRTLFAPWRKDRVSYAQGSLSGMAKAFVFNMISRGVGAVIRSGVLLLWLVLEVAYLPLAGLVWLLITFAPLVAAVFIVLGTSLLVAPGV